MINDCRVVCLASHVDDVLCPFDSCDIDDGVRSAPTPEQELRFQQRQAPKHRRRALRQQGDDA